jgi:hypothetical protein
MRSEKDFTVTIASSHCGCRADLWHSAQLQRNYLNAPGLLNVGAAIRERKRCCGADPARMFYFPGPLPKYPTCGRSAFDIHE